MLKVVFLIKTYVEILQVLHYRIKIMAITYVSEPLTPSPRSAIKAAKDKYFNTNQSSRSNSIASVHDDPAVGMVSSTSSFEEIRQATSTDSTEKDIIDKMNLKSMVFSEVVRAAMSAAAAKAVAVTTSRKTDEVSSTATTLSRVNSVPKPPRQSLEIDKNDEDLKPLLEKESVTPPPLPDTPIPKTDKVLEFAKSNVD